MTAVPCAAAGTNGSGGHRRRRAQEDVRDGGELSGRFGGMAYERRHGPRRGRQDEQTAEELTHLVESEGQLGDDAEVAAATADGPEQLGIVVFVDAAHPAVGGDDLGLDERVHREPVLAREVSHAAAEGETRDAHRRGVAESDGQAVRRQGGGDLAGGQPGAGTHGALPQVHVEAGQSPNVQQDAAGGTESGDAVPAGPDRQLHPRLGGQFHGPDDVRDAVRNDDQRREVFGTAEGERPAFVVAGLARQHDRAVDPATEVRPGCHSLAFGCRKLG